MKIDLKNSIMGLLMLGTAMAVTVACNSQKNKNAEVPVEDTVKIDNAIKTKGYAMKNLFDAQQQINYRKIHEAIDKVDLQVSSSIDNIANQIGYSAKDLEDFLVKEGYNLDSLKSQL